MANQGLSQVLPYKFRNTGSKTGSIANILQAPQLELLEINIPLSADLTAVIARADGESEVIKTNTRNMYGYSAIAQLLSGKSEEMLLWEVGIWAGRIEFNFRNKTLRLMKQDSKSTTSKIAIDANLGSRFRFLAAAFDKESERQLFCEYGEDIVWGKNLHIVEYEDGRGVQEAMFYPRARKNCLEKLIRA